MPIVGFLLAIALLVVGSGSNLAAMIDPPSFLIVFGFTLGALLMSGADIPLMLRGINAGSLTPEEASRAAAGWKTARMAGLAAGGLGTMMGWIIMLKNLDDPVAIGPGMVISLLTVMYGLILAFVIALPLQTKLTPGERDASASRGATFAILLSALVSISMYSILALPFATTG